MMIDGELSWSIGIVANAGFQMVLLVVMAASGDRWSLAAVWHATVNAFGASFFFTMRNGVGQARRGLLLAAAYAVLAITGFILSRRLKASREQSRTTAARSSAQIR